jgi:hypothetical protein
MLGIWSLLIKLTMGKKIERQGIPLPVMPYSTPHPSLDPCTAFKRDFVKDTCMVFVVHA